jgi:hypothetical protein
MVLKDGLRRAVTICALVGMLGIYTSKNQEETITQNVSSQEITIEELNPQIVTSEPEKTTEQKTPEEPSPNVTFYNKFVYQDFNSIDFNVSKEPINWLNELNVLHWFNWLNPLNWNKHSVWVFDTEPRIENKKKLENIVFTEAEKIGYSQEKIANLRAHEAIDLSVQIVCNLLNYYDVDLDKDFIQKYGEHLPIEKYLETGLGDCDKYATGVKAVFDVIAKGNPNTERIYVFSQGLGGYTIRHAWSTIIFMTDGNLIMAQIDPTFYDNNAKLEAERGFHIPKSYLELEANFLKDISLFKESSNCYEKLYTECLKKEKEDPHSLSSYTNPECLKYSWEGVKAHLLGEMAYLSFQLKNKQKMDIVREKYIQLFSNEDLDKTSEYDTILYYSFKVEENGGNISNAQKYKKELVTRFPESFWIRCIN